MFVDDESSENGARSQDDGSILEGHLAAEEVKEFNTSFFDQLTKECY